MTKCKNCKETTFTYNGWCNKCAWEQMNFWKGQVIALRHDLMERDNER